MPPIPQNAYRVLVTGFGPFAQFSVNPSWAAVKPLHDEILHTDPSIYAQRPSRGSKSRPIHITSIMVPVTYADVLQRVPGFHARPPYLPHDSEVPEIAPPHDGYDLVFHVGVAGRGALRLEKLGHKLGYKLKDVNGELAPVVERKEQADGDLINAEPSAAEMLERQRILGPSGSTVPSSGKDDVLRGFGTGYEEFDDEIHTDVDVDAMLKHIRQSNPEVYGKSYASIDAGHYLCDFIYYCSLAESKRTAGPPLPPYAQNMDPKTVSRVFFLHCPPLNSPHPTSEVTEAVRKMIVWILSS